MSARFAPTRPPLVVLLAATCALVACAAGDDASSGVDASEATVDPPPERDPEMACMLVTSAKAEGSCREDWACPSSGLLSVICVDTGTDVTCVCSDGEQVLSQFTSDALDCDVAGGNLDWFVACGWSMTP
jgi:hypothetical protein